MQKTKLFILAFVAWEWISSVTKSLFKLASYLVEFPMVASGVYIMIATGIPAANSAWWFNLAFGVLLSAPEILAPGAFFRAETMQALGKVRAARVTRWLAGAMLFFAALTFSSIMIFHWDANVLQGIMFFRVMTSLGYSIITRIDMEQGGLHAPSVNQEWGFTLVAMMAAIEQVHTEQQQIVNLVRSELQRMNQEMVNQVHNVVNFQVNQTIQEHSVELHNQNQQTINTALERLEQVNTRRLEAVWTRLEQVRVTMESQPVPPALSTRLALTKALSEPRRERTVNQESEPLKGFTGECVNQENEGSQESKVNLVRGFTVNHYQKYGSLPTLTMIMAAVECKKTLASRTRKLVAQELGIEKESEHNHG